MKCLKKRGNLFAVLRWFALSASVLGTQACVQTYDVYPDAGIAPDGGVPIPDDAGVTVDDQGRSVDRGTPRPVVIPDVTAVGVNCSNAQFARPELVRPLYDDYFGVRIPKNDADFGWKNAVASEVSAEVVNRVKFYGISTPSDEQYHQYFSFDPNRFSRSSSGKNWDLFGTFNSAAQPLEAYKRYNPGDFVPAALTHYARKEPGVSDIMASQFVYRMACYRDKMEQALRACPDCIDVIAMLSKYDLYKVFEVRFVRMVGNQFQISKVFKLISVDASGHMFQHGPSAPYPYVRYSGSWLYAKWRGELSGTMAHRLDNYMQPTPALIRLAPNSPGY